MIKELIIITTFLLIYNTLESIKYAQAIFNFTILAQYISYNNKMM